MNTVAIRESMPVFAVLIFITETVQYYQESRGRNNYRKGSQDM